MLKGSGEGLDVEASEEYTPAPDPRDLGGSQVDLREPDACDGEIGLCRPGEGTAENLPQGRR
jgi:hypothetical protein